MTETPVLHRPELLAPAGERACIKAAIENGADAVYFGLDTGFNARARATNFPVESLPEVMAELHERGARGYATLNTLIFSSELRAFETTVRHCAAAGVDAVLLQDVGACRLVRAICPDLPIHASTQMTLSSAECLAAATELGLSRVVLPRELSLDEIRDVRAKSQVPLEAFVHGALCVAYSGQCLTSESLGGRSANRGQCAQACRLPYEVFCDDRPVDLGPQKYLLSPQDLAGYELTPELIAAGISSFKIEGRLKTPEYVANITRHYRQAIDTALAGNRPQLTATIQREMELSFSRGFSPGWLEGCDHKRLVPALSSSKRGVLLGVVCDLQGERPVIQLATSLKPGDGVVFEGDRFYADEQGGRVYELTHDRQPVKSAEAGQQVVVGFATGAIDVARLTRGQQVYLTDDPQLAARLRASFSSEFAQRRTGLHVHVEAVVGQPLRCVATTPTGVTAEASSPQPLTVARTRPTMAEFLEAEWNRLGKTIFQLEKLTCNLAGNPMTPLSVLSDVRQQVIAQLVEKLRSPVVREVAPPDIVNRLRAADHAAALETPTLAQPLLHVLVRTQEPLAALMPITTGELTADFADPREYKAAIQACRAAGRWLWVAPPRIQKPGEMGLFHQLRKYEADGWLVRNLAAIDYCREHNIPFVADYSLNAANELTTHWLMHRGARRVTASYDLNREQLVELAERTQAPQLEVVLHQHMPMFHMEHCVFCAVLSPGTNKTNCGRPCDHHLVELQDRTGVRHPLKADVGCRNTLFNAQPQSGAEVADELLAAGVQHFRLELLDESAAQSLQAVQLYQQLLQGQATGADVWRQLHAANRVGVTRGSLEAARNPLAIL